MTIHVDDRGALPLLKIVLYKNSQIDVRLGDTKIKNIIFKKILCREITEFLLYIG